VQSFKLSNLSHILAVSGAQISYIILGITYLINKSRLSKRKTNIFIIFAIVLFMAVTGFTASVVRASIMGIVVLGGKIFYRKSDIWTSIAFSLLIILVQNPLTINNIGLQLSYLGTIGIILFYKRIENILLNVAPTKTNKVMQLLVQRSSSYTICTNLFNSNNGI